MPPRSALPTPVIHRPEPGEEFVRVPPAAVSIHTAAIAPRGRRRSAAPMIGCSMPAVPRVLPGPAQQDVSTQIPAFLRAR